MNMEFALNNTSVTTIETECLVIGIHDDIALVDTAAAIDKASGGALQKLLDSGDIDTSWKDTTMLHGISGISAKRVLVIGCGAAEKLTSIRYDIVCEVAGNFLRDHVVESALVCMHELDVEARSPKWRIRQAAIAFDRANYRYTTTKPPKDHDHNCLTEITFSADESMKGALQEAKSIAKGYLRARELGNLPPNICTPSYLAKQAKRIADDYKNVSVKTLKRKEMAELKMEALLAVGQGSTNGPRLIVLKYNGKEDDSQPIVLVGKGITFDTGGISLKAGQNMEQMKFDMGGAAAVLGAFEACVNLQLPINLITIVAAAENMPDGKAYRPGDVLTSMSGQTIEVINTDAEGRLVLCDALTYSQRFNPAVLIDVATLTGAAVISLGHHASAIMSKHDDLASDLMDAGLETIDRGWRLPIWDEYQSQLKSPFADMKNVGGMPAGSITAGCFLSRFTDGQYWAHIDCAGSTWQWGTNNGSTGRPVGLLTQYLINQAG